MQDKDSQKSRTAIVNALKRAQQTGAFSLADQNLTQFPAELCKIAELDLEQKWWEINPVTKIDLSNNKINQIPPEIVQLLDLGSLRMANNKLTDLPDELFLLKSLKLLDLTHNSLTVIPESICNAEGLVELNVSDNQLKSLPMGLSACRHLEKIDASQNFISSLPVDFSALRKLKFLNLSQNKLTAIPQSIGKLTELDQLLLAKNQIKDIPENSLSCLPKIKLLDLKENKLQYFTEFPRSTAFDSIFLGFNLLTHLDNFENSPNLTVLDVKNNKLTGLQSSIYNLKNLKTLDVSNNDLSDIPSEIGFMKVLVRIHVEGNPLKCIRSSVKSSGAEGLKKFLRDRAGGNQPLPEDAIEKPKQYDVWNQYIRDFLSGKELIMIGQPIGMIPDQFCDLTNLLTLDLSNSGIREINPNLAKLQNLTKLRLNDNKIDYLDPGLFYQLLELEQLELRGNCLDSLFDGAERYMDIPIPKIAYLDLSNNRFKSLPPILARFTQLRALVMAYNQINSLDAICTPNLKVLDTLDFSNNKIAEVPENIMALAKLENLNLENNSLDKLPTFLGFLPSLKSVKLMGNKLKIIKRDVLEKGGKQMVEYLRERHPTPVKFTSGNTTPMEKENYQGMMIEKGSTPGKGSYGKEFMDIEQESYHRNPYEKPRQEEIKVEYEPRKYYAPEKKEPPQMFAKQKEMEVMKEVQILEASIAALEKELQDNFTLSTNQIMTKKREINKLRAARTNLLNSLKS